MQPRTCILSAFTLVVGLALLFGNHSFAQQVATCDGPQDACQQIIKGLKQFEAAYNRKDVTAVGAGFTPDAVIVQEGPILSGREAIEKFYGDGFNGASAKCM
jgi:ketosteroid isomerase-like protein